MGTRISDPNRSAIPSHTSEHATAIRDGRLEDEGWRVRKDGSRFWGNVVITALRNATGAHAGFAKVARDLTERRAAELQAVADARSVTSAPQEQYLARIRGSQQHLLAIINDILNFSRIEAAQLTYDSTTVSLETVVDAVLPMIEPQATAKGLAISRTSFRAADVCGDRSKIEQILLNLLSNAVKFTTTGGFIELTCAEHEGLVELSVGDTGIGIPIDEIGGIFQPCIQIGRTLTSTQEGTGLALAISSDLAKAMGGELSVRSAFGEGSTFTLTLPAASSA